MFWAFKAFQKRVKFTWPILIVALGVLASLIFIRLYLLQTAKQFSDDFYSQNSLILGRGDSFELAYKLNYLSSSVHWVCIKATKDGKVIFENNRSSDCNEGIFQTKQAISSHNNQDILVEFTIAIPWMLKIILLVFVVIQSLLIGLFYFVRMKSRQDKINSDFAWQRKLNQVATQVAHDIRSPLSALKLATSFLPDEVIDQKKLLISVSNRIESILSDLVLRESVESISNNMPQNGYAFILPVIQSIVSEKVVVCAREFPDVEIKFIENQSMDDVGCLINDQELMRVLSNVINNALEAFDSYAIKKQIKISMSLDKVSVIIKICDTGKGMTSEQIDKILSVGGTFGKANGKGLGIKHARETIHGAKGEIKFSSKIGVGTEVSLILPLAESPLWLCRSIDLRGKNRIVVLDDDASVLEAWRAKFHEIDGVMSIAYFNSPNHFKIADYNASETLFIVDHDFSGNEIKGLEFIRKFSLGHNAILCTSYFSDPRIQREILELESRILPKHSMATINLIIDQTNEDFRVVLIDDDELMHSAWKMAARWAKVELDCYFSYAEFKKVEYSIHTPIFVDKNLDRECGLKISEKLFSEQGFSKIYLSTGERLNQNEVPKYITKILGDKVFPERLVMDLKQNHQVTYH